MLKVVYWQQSFRACDRRIEVKFPCRDERLRDTPDCEFCISMDLCFGACSTSNNLSTDLSHLL
jgi:hypothetical protein